MRIDEMYENIQDEFSNEKLNAQPSVNEATIVGDDHEFSNYGVMIANFKSKAKLSPKVIKALDKVASDFNTEVLMSARKRQAYIQFDDIDMAKRCYLRIESDLVTYKGLVLSAYDFTTNNQIMPFRDL